MEHTVTTKKWYVVSGTAGDTVTSPDGSKIFCTVPEGGQGIFYATAPIVVTSNDSVEVVETTFNSAPVKMKLLGLLGGGVSNGLPSGYLAAEFLESTGEQYMKLPLKLSTEDSVRIVQEHFCVTRGNFFEGQNTYMVDKCVLRVGQYDAAYYLNRGEGAAVGKITLNSWVLFDCYFYGTMARLTQRDGTIIERDMNTSAPCKEYWLWRWNNSTSQKWNGKKKYFRVEVNEKLFCDMLPSIDENGVPCMYDRVTKQPFRNAGTGQFIVGMTLKQARKLGKLPAGGGSLTVSLPSNYAEDEGVVNALAAAQENGWVITIQTYEAEAGAASTFALRRIWVRKDENEQGSYVDSDGTRWQVEWCVDIVGVDPEDLGYEPFRSVEAAVKYWNLTAWVDPEAEEILTNTDEQ